MIFHVPWSHGGSSYYKTFNIVFTKFCCILLYIPSRHSDNVSNYIVFWGLDHVITFLVLLFREELSSTINFIPVFRKPKKEYMLSIDREYTTDTDSHPISYNKWFIKSSRAIGFLSNWCYSILVRNFAVDLFQC